MMPAGITTDQFKESFRIEAREIVANLELALLELNSSPGDEELVASVFRGLHTIKGSGAMFGFDELAAFTHDLETAFDEVRNGRLEVTEELVDLTLSALDHVRQLIGDVDTPNAIDSRMEILTQVQKLTGQKTTAGDSDSAGDETPSGHDSATREWLIRFVPGTEMLRDGTDPLLLLGELRQLGRLSIRAVTDAVPALEDLDPERCYVVWDAVLLSAASEDTIRDVFIFVEGLCELTVEPLQCCTSPHSSRTASVDSLIRHPGKGANPIHEPLRRGEPQEAVPTLRIRAAKLDQFVDLVGELVTVQARLSEMAAGHENADLAEVSEQIERLTSALRENSMTLRMIPIRGTFERFRRLVHDLAREMSKQVELKIEGGETELDKSVIEQLNDPLMHLIRNSMDHGIEDAETRAARGKKAMAKITLSARHAGTSVLITVEDDGGGIDLAAVRKRAVERGLIDTGALLTEAETYALLFRPGFSTAVCVTDISGRGVGMDVVQRNVESLRGTVEIASRPGEGTKVILRLPLTMAIIDGLLVRVAGASFVLPLANALECIELTREEIARSNGKHLISVRGEILAYIRLREYFHLLGRAPAQEQVMIVENEGERYGLVVDEVLGNCQTVIKSLGRMYRHVQMVSGATILGNGSVALILDPERLVQEATRTLQSRSRGHPVSMAGGGPTDCSTAQVA